MSQTMLLPLAFGGGKAARAAGVTLAQIQALFGGGQQGVINDLTDAGSVFQERTGAAATTPSGADGAIGSLKDLSPNANWSTAPSDAARPLWRAAGYLQSDGTDDRLVTGGIVLDQPYTRVSCFRLITRAGSFDTVLNGASTGKGELYIDGASPLSLKMYSGADLALGAVVAGQDYVVTEQYNGASSRGAINNGGYTSGNPSTGATQGLSIASEPADGFSEIRLYRVVLIAGLLSDADIAKAKTWCGAAAGLAL